MNRLLLIILLSSISICSSLAQFKIGVKGGLNFSTIVLTPDTDLDITPLSSFHIGGFFNYGITENFGIQMELLYSVEGGRFLSETNGQIGDGPFETLDLELKDKLTFFSVPLLLRYHHESGFTAELGPSFNFLLKARRSLTQSNTTSDLALTQDLEDTYTSADTKIAFGLGYELASGTSFNGRLAVSLANIQTEEASLDGSEAVISMFQLSVGFPLYGN